MTTLQEAFNTFIRQYANPVTRSAYEQTMREFLPRFAHHDVTSITVLDLLNWSADIRAPERGLAEATIYKHIKHLKAFFNWLHRVELIGKNPAKAIKQVRITQTRSSRQLISRQQIDTLRKSLEGDLRGLALVLFLADTGCRRGGAAGLRVRDLHLRARSAEVFEKDKKTRTVFFGRACAAALSNWLKSRPSTALDDYVFSRDGAPISSSSLAQFFRRRCIAAGLGSFGPHRLRRHKIVSLLSERVSPKVVQDLVGHRNIETTLKYVPRDVEAIRRVADEYAIEDEPSQQEQPKSMIRSRLKSV